ncbi:MAG: hypothetical protein QM705_08040 [Ancrocorticia sp.]
MNSIQLAEIKASWRAWLSVSIVFIAINAALCITALTYWTGRTAVNNGVLTAQAASYYTWSQLLVGMFIVLVSMPIIGSMTGLVVDARRGALARLSLAGATPRQVRSTINAQLIVVSLMTAVIGALISLVGTIPWLLFGSAMYKNEDEFVLLDLAISPIPLLIAAGFTALVSIIAGSRQARAASLIPPVEALRLSQAPSRTPRLKWSSWIKIILLALIVVVSWVSVRFQVQNMYKETVSNLFIISWAQIFVWGALLSVIAPVLVAPLTRFWTKLVPGKAPSWILARSTVSARADRLYKSVVPVMFTFTVGVGAMAIGETGVKTISVYLGDPGIAGSMTLKSYAYMFGFPLIIAFSAGIASLIMMGKQRDAELALVGIVGATPKQRRATPALEALIITISAVLLSLLAIIPSLGFMAYAFVSAGLPWTVDIPWLIAAVIFFGGLVLTGLATVLPTIPASRQPEPRVIARLVAE